MPISEKIIPKIIADKFDILLEGKGRFFVLIINPSFSLSINWLKILEAPAMAYPPIESKNNV